MKLQEGNEDLGSDNDVRNGDIGNLDAAWYTSESGHGRDLSEEADDLVDEFGVELFVVFEIFSSLFGDERSDGVEDSVAEGLDVVRVGQAGGGVDDGGEDVQAFLDGLQKRRRQVQ